MDPTHAQVSNDDGSRKRSLRQRDSKQDSKRPKTTSLSDVTRRNNCLLSGVTTADGRVNLSNDDGDNEEKEGTYRYLFNSLRMH